MDLAQWQSRLSGHFTGLRVTRSAAGVNRPIFALEHGLDLGEVQALSSAIHDHIAQEAPSREHELAWLVYAAELGYKYSGDEFWQTFDAETPGWTAHGNRYWIRDSYRSFHRKLGGARPSGAWAEHFSIICWPITHAILPRDLQRQLARILYEIRHSFSAELFESPSRLGEFIEARSWNATSRFQNLAQETLLVGQIAAALLLQWQSGSSALIHPATLRRIGDDLDRERRAREWLHGARRFAQERARVHGLALGRSSVLATSRRPEEAREEIAALGIEPRLVLRPSDTSGDSWAVSLELPNLSQILLRFPQTREVLTNARCRVAGAESQPRPGGWLLLGAQRITLRRWPKPQELLLQFDRSDPQLDFLLRTDCLLRPGPVWLFRVASDGLAYESRSLRVRPGERYVVLAPRSIGSGPHAREVAVACDGICGAALDLPSALTDSWQETLKKLGLAQARAVEVWPAGLGAMVWDGEGHGEWLASERPCLALLTDHPLDALLVSMAGSSEPALAIAPVEAGEPIFIELPQLPVGLHAVRVHARALPGSAPELLGDLDVVMRIREARSWSQGVNTQSPVIVQLDPPAPTLEQVWEGRVEVTLRGPKGRRIKCRVSLFDRDGDTAVVSKQLPPLDLPVPPRVWAAHFETHFRETKEASVAYDTARTCELQFAAEDLGRFSVSCERAFTPLRWVVRRSGHEHALRLIDDSGCTPSPVVSRFSFETPAREEVLGVRAEFAAPAAGGLFVAKCEGWSAAVVVPPAVVRDLAHLGCSPLIDKGVRSADSLLRVLKLTSLWGGARQTGLFSGTRRRDVMEAFTRYFAGLLGGDNWASAELAPGEVGTKLWHLISPLPRLSRGALHAAAPLGHSISKRHEEAALGPALAAECETLLLIAPKERVLRLAALAARFLSIPKAPAAPQLSAADYAAANWARWLSELALRIASDPAHIEEWAGDWLKAGIGQLLDLPALARAARFLVIASSHHQRQPRASGEVYVGWDWA